MGIMEKIMKYPKNFIKTCNKYIRIDVTEKTCLCESLHIVLWIIRIFGLLPITWGNIQSKVGDCLYKKSITWKIYQYTLIIILLVQLFIHIFLRDASKTILHTSAYIFELNSIITMLLQCVCMLQTEALTLDVYNIFVRMHNCKEKIYCQEHAYYVMQFTKRSAILYAVTTILQFIIWFSSNRLTGWSEFLDQFPMKIICSISGVFFTSASTKFLYCSLLIRCFQTVFIRTFPSDNLKKYEMVLDSRKISKMEAIANPKYCCKIDGHNNIDQIFDQCKSTDEKYDILRHLLGLKITTFKLCCITDYPFFHICYTSIVFNLIIIVYILVVMWQFDADIRTEFLKRFFTNLFTTFQSILFLSGTLIYITSFKKELGRLKDILLIHSADLTDRREKLQVRYLIGIIEYCDYRNCKGIDAYTVSKYTSMCHNVLTYFLITIQYRIPDN